MAIDHSDAGRAAPARTGAPGPPPTVVPEPEVKAALGALGVAVPRSACAATPGGLTAAAATLRAPLVLKAFGPAIVHKTDVGAVALGLRHEGLGAAAEAMARTLADGGVAVAGWLVEEQAPAGLDVLVGAVRRPGWGVVVAVGLGGEWAEVLDDVAFGLHPVSEADTARLVDSWAGSRLLDGYRGGPPLDRAALVRVVTALAGPGGLVDRVGRPLQALECNPVRVFADGAVALDARLLVDGPLRAPLSSPPAGPGGGAPAAQGAPGAPATGDFDRLLRPRRVAIAGASASGRPSFGTRALEAYRALGWDDGLVAIHPEATEIAGVPAWPSASALPEPVDYLLVAVPAAQCAAVVSSAAGKARFVHVLSGGFAEAGAEGARLQAALVDAARAAGARLLGPNCMGIYSPAGRHAFQLDAPPEPGGIAVFSQSGGLAGDIVKTGYARGLRFSAVVSLGNAADVTPAELVAHAVGEPATEAVGLYVEGPGDDGALVEALRRARGRVPVTLLVGGTSDQGAQAASSHTGALAGDARLWAAVSSATGATVVTTLEDFLGVLRFHQVYGRRGPAAPAVAGPAAEAAARTAAAPGPAVLVVGAGGGASVLATDACARAGLRVAPTTEALRAHLVGLGYGVGMSVANPMEVAAGPLAPADAFHRLIDEVLAAQAYADVVLHLNVQSYLSFGGDGLAVLRQTLGLLSPERFGDARVAVVLRNQEAAPPEELASVVAAALASGVPFYRTFDEAALSVAAGQRFAAGASAAASAAAGVAAAPLGSPAAVSGPPAAVSGPGSLP